MHYYLEACISVFFTKKDFSQTLVCNFSYKLYLIYNVVVNPFRSKVKPVLIGHSKINKTKVLETNGSLMKFESITVKQYF